MLLYNIGLETINSQKSQFLSLIRMCNRISPLCARCPACRCRALRYISSYFVFTWKLVCRVQGLGERLRAPCVVAGRASEGGGHPGRPAAAAVGQGVDQGRRPRGRTEGDETRLQKRWRTVGMDSDNSAKFRFSNLWFGRAMDLSSDGKGCWIIAARVRWQWNERDRDCIGACMLYRPVACVL